MRYVRIFLFCSLFCPVHSTWTVTCPVLGEGDHKFYSNQTVVEHFFEYTVSDGFIYLISFQNITKYCFQSVCSTPDFCIVTKVSKQNQICPPCLPSYIVTQIKTELDITYVNPLHLLIGVLSFTNCISLVAVLVCRRQIVVSSFG
uniref:Uncharacterized protein n=2 Tax=unclassified Gammacoronavirus TaxID=1433214 RepID=A0AB39ADC6_9GAMC